jgi:hypothetical protein
MRPRFLIFISILTLAILVIIFWLRPVQRTTTSEPTQGTIQPVSNAPTVTSSVRQNVSSQPPPTVPPSASSPPELSMNEKTAKIIREFYSNHSLPIEFYGQIIDQDSNPVPNVKINISIPRSYLFPPNDSGAFPMSNSVVRLEKETGSDGRFEINGETGDEVEIKSVQKNGYEPEPNIPHSFGASSGSLESPVVFRMWPTNLHEQLISDEKHYHIQIDGRPYFINLTDGTIAESGDADLKVSIKYPAEIISGQTNNWLSEVDVINGGLFEETDSSSSMFSAPANGYTPTFQYNQQIRDGQRGSIGTRRFYVRLKSGQEYGRVTIELYAPYNNQIPGMIRLSYAINPSGSHILR